MSHVTLPAPPLQLRVHGRPGGGAGRIAAEAEGGGHDLSTSNAALIARGSDGKSVAHALPSGPAAPASLEQKFEEDFSQHIQKKNRLHRFQLGAMGAGIGGFISAAAAPVFIPGVCVAALVGGASGYQWAKRWGKHELHRHGGAANDDPQIPTLRRLKYLVKWGHWQILEYEDSPGECQSAVLDEVVRAFSPWVQKLYLLRARGCAGEADPEAREVLLHLAPLYYLLQRRATLEAIVQCADDMTSALDDGTLEPPSAERLRLSFPTILETISIVDRLSPAMHAQLYRETQTSASTQCGALSANRAHRRHRLQRIVGALRKVLERTDVQEALADHRFLEPRRMEADGEADAGVELDPAPIPSPASSSSASRMQLVVPPEGVENEHGGPDEDADYFSVSEESEDEGIPTRSGTKRLDSKKKKGAQSTTRANGGAGSASFARRLEAFPMGEYNHTWTHFDAGEFVVRSDSYLLDKRKMPSEPSMVELVNVDFQLIGPDGPVWRSAEHEDFYPAHHRRRGDPRFLLVQNWVFPPFQCVLTGAVDPAAQWLRGGRSRSPQARLWEKFLEMDNEERRDVFKVICSVEDGPWLVKRALPKLPVLIGKKLGMSSHHVPGEYLELVLDVASGRGLQMTVGMVSGALRHLKLAFSALIEAREEEDLPENILLSASMLHLDPSKLFSPEVPRG